VTENFDATLRTGFVDQLSSATPSRSGARLAAILADIEKAFDAGFSRVSVHEALNKAGFMIGFQAFVKCLYRVRKKAREAMASLQPRKATPPPPPAWMDVQSPAPAPASTHATQAPSPVKPERVVTPRVAPIATAPLQAGVIGEIARSQPDMVGLAKKGREYAAKLAADEKRKALEAASNKAPD
jgi:hypothetical protein